MDYQPLIIIIIIIKPYIIKPLHWPWITMNHDEWRCSFYLMSMIIKPYLVQPLYWPWITMNPDGHSICPWSSSYSHDIPVMVMPWPLYPLPTIDGHWSRQGPPLRVHRCADGSAGARVTGPRRAFLGWSSWGRGQREPRVARQQRCAGRFSFFGEKIRM